MHSVIKVDRPAVFARVTILSVVLFVIAVVWGQFDTRILDGEAVWLKPAKFSLSLFVHFATLAIIVAALTENNRKRRSIAVAGGVMAAAYLTEIAYIFYQAVLAEHSHFNDTTPFHITMYSLMGVGAVLLISLPVVVAWYARHDPNIGAATKIGIWWGALTSFLLTLIVAGYLSNNGSHFVGMPSDPSRVLPLFGWSTEVGDLRPAHFLSLHALQILPLAGLWIDRTGRSIAIIKPFALAYAFLCLAVFGQSLLGQPLISMQ